MYSKRWYFRLCKRCWGKRHYRLCVQQQLCTGDDTSGFNEFLEHWGIEGSAGNLYLTICRWKWCAGSETDMTAGRKTLFCTRRLRKRESLLHERACCGSFGTNDFAVGRMINKYAGEKMTSFLCQGTIFCPIPASVNDHRHVLTFESWCLDNETRRNFLNCGIS